MSESTMARKTAGGSLIEQARGAAADRKAAAAAAYFELLSRNAQPRPGDAAALAEAMHTLGRTAESLDEDVALVGKILGAERAAAELKTLDEAEHPAAREKHKAASARLEAERSATLKRWKAELAAMEAEWGAAVRKRFSLVQVAKELDSLRREFAAITGQPVPESQPTA